MAHNRENAGGFKARLILSMPVAVALLYFSWIIMTPQIRFPILGDIYAEKMLMALGWIVAFANYKKQKLPINRIAVVLLIFTIMLYVGFLLSPYSYNSLAQQWAATYWKKIVFFLLLIFLLQSKRDLEIFVGGCAVLLFAYELYSLVDFARGGSYVYQQGVVRAVGVWSGGGFGKPNAFGFYGLISIPFSIYFLTFARTARMRWLGIAMVFVALLAIFLSGTRGALVSAILILFLAYGRRLWNPKIVVPACVASVVLWNVISDDVKSRYFSILPGVDTAEVSNEIAASSAEGRVEGLRDGVVLFLHKPILGYGPGSTPLARIPISDYVNRDPDGPPKVLGLHNLYGQLLAETGLVGTLLFGYLLVLAIRVSNPAWWHNIKDESNGMIGHPLLPFIRYLLVAIFSYGMFDHNLYSYYWLVLFAIVCCIFEIRRDKPPILNDLSMTERPKAREAGIAK